MSNPRVKTRIGVTELANIADNYGVLVESQKREWDERIARLDQRDRLTWEAMIMGMTRLGIAQYVGDIYLTVAPTAWRGNDCVRRLCHDVNREIAREMGEAV